MGTNLAAMIGWLFHLMDEDKIVVEAKKVVYQWRQLEKGATAMTRTSAVPARINLNSPSPPCSRHDPYVRHWTGQSQLEALLEIYDGRESAGDSFPVATALSSEVFYSPDTRENPELPCLPCTQCAFT
jgi:hypothetical protein